MGGNDSLEHDTAQDDTEHEVPPLIPIHQQDENTSEWLRWDNPEIWEGEDDDS